ncbi:reverse transcriptase domain-containing protein [Tanacetum coccineum]
MKAVKAHLNFEETSQHSELGAPSRRRDIRKRLGPKDACSMFRSPEPRRDRSRSPRRKDPERETVFRILKKGVFHRLGDKEKGMSVHSGNSRRQSYHNSRRDTESYYQSSHSRGTEPALKRHNDRKAYSRKGGRMSESEDNAGGHWKSKSKKQRSSVEDEDLSQPWVCEETNSFTPRIRYFDLTKRIRMPSHVKTYDGSEDPEDRLKILQAAAKIESRDIKGAPKVMRISGFMHGITNPELIKRLQDKIPKFVDEMWKITTAFLRGEVAVGNQERKKTFQPWKQQDVGHRQNFKKGGFKNQQRSEKRQDRFALHSKTPKEILALEKGKFKAPPPMTTPVEKRNSNKFYEFHGEEIKQSNGKDPHKINKKGEASDKDKALAILMVQPWQRVARQRITQSFSPNPEISFPPIDEEEGAEGPMIIEAEVGGHFIHRMYVDGGSASEIMYEHCFNKLLPEVKSRMVPATAPLIGFSGEIIWPLGQISLLVKFGDAEHSTSAFMNFMVVRSASPYNRIIGRPGIRKIQAVPSTAHGMLKFLLEG